MSDDTKPTNPEEEKNFFVDRAKGGRAACKKCKMKIESGRLRLAKMTFNPFGTGKMKNWHHVECLFEVFKKQRASTAKIEHFDDIGNWSNISKEDQEEIFKFLPQSARIPRNPPEDAGSKSSANVSGESSSSTSGSASKQETKKGKSKSTLVKDNLFRNYRRLCVDVAAASSYTSKTAIVKELITKGSDRDGFKGDLILWLRLLLPGCVKRTYNLQSKQLVKLFSRLFGEDQDEMLKDLEKGDVAETVGRFFEKSSICKPTKKSFLTLKEVDNFLEYLSKLTREEDQLNHFKNIASKSTSNDLRMIVRLIKHDLRINAGAKHILEAVHPDAYQAFQTSRDLTSVIKRLMNLNGSSSSGAGEGQSSKNNVTVSLCTPVLPMLAEVCKSVEQAMKKCPNGMYSEIKYDGERVQVHKQGSEFKYFSRSLKPVLPHKINHFKDYIPKAFPLGNDMILDSEILMVDLNTGKPLPFGTLGIHKKSEFKDASVCLFIFDCLYYNNESLLNKPLKERKQILVDNMTEIPNHVVFSEMEEIHDPEELESMMTKVFRLGLEGLVLKDIMSPYEPGKRHWLKVKKDYLFDGAMADTADLVVVGAWYGTGQKGGMMSVFLMGCHDSKTDKWCTVTKVHTGHDNKTLERLQGELDMIKISKDQSKVPDWLLCTKTMIPDFVARDPKAQPVWEITGAEFTKHDVHTAGGISVRFPRVTRIRSDKDWETATNLQELKDLFKKSKNNSDFQLLSSSSDPGCSSSTISERKRGNDASPAPGGKKKRANSSQSHSVDKKKQQALLDVTTRKIALPNIKQTKHPKSNTKKENKSVPHRDKEFGKKTRNEDDENSENVKMKKFKRIKKPLPDVFDGVKLFISEHCDEEGIKDRKLLETYFTAYGGKLLKENESSEATHIVTSSKSDDSKSSGVIEVDPRWLWDSIKLKRQQDTSLY